VLYAVLLAFVVIVVWEKFSDAESDVSREAGAAATIYRLVEGMDGELGPTLRNGLTAYLQSCNDRRLGRHGKWQSESRRNTRA
jgi:hypothetical protein